MIRWWDRIIVLSDLFFDNLCRLDDFRDTRIFADVVFFFPEGMDVWCPVTSEYLSENVSWDGDEERYSHDSIDHRQYFTCCGDRDDITETNRRYGRDGEVERVEPMPSFCNMKSYHTSDDKSCDSDEDFGYSDLGRIEGRHRRNGEW